MTFDAKMVNANDVLHMAEVVGRQAARALLQDAELYFRGWTELYAMRQHLFYLENHCRARGVQFTPWQDTEDTSGAFKYARYAAWPFPKPFSEKML